MNNQPKVHIKDLDPMIRGALEEIIEDPSYPRRLTERSVVVLKATGITTISQISREVKMDRKHAAKWIKRFNDNKDYLMQKSEEGNREKLREAIIEVLSDKPRSGRPRVYSDDQQEKIIEIVRKSPRDFGFNKDEWTNALIYKAVMQEGVAPGISKNGILNILDRVGLKPPKRRRDSIDIEEIKKDE